MNCMRHLSLFAILAVPGFTAFAEEPPSCETKLTGAWLRAEAGNRYWVPEGQPKEPVLAVRRLALEDGGHAVETTWYEHPDRRGVKDTTAPPPLPPFDVPFEATWEVRPSGSTDANRCYFVVDNDDWPARNYTVTFEGPDRFVEVGSNAVYDRDVSSRTTP